MNLLRTVLAYLEYLAIRLLGLLYALVPANRAYALGFSLTASFYPLFRSRRRIAVDNILKARITAGEPLLRANLEKNLPLLLSGLREEAKELSVGACWNNHACLRCRL